MKEIIITILVAMGIPTAITGFAFWLIQRRITAQDKRRAKLEAEREERAAAREKAREELDIHLLECSTAAIALGEATARAVQRIPDAHCNGDMHNALNYAAEVKHRQRDFLTKQGIHALFDE